MNILQFLNNGYDPKLILGYGGLGYKPPIYGYGIIEKDDEGEYVVDTEWNKKRSNYIINSEAPTKFLWSVFYNPDADEEDKKIVKEILDENYKNDPKKFIDKSNAYLDSLPPEEKNKRLVPVLDFYGQKVSQEVDDVSNYFKELKKVKKPETKEESESEEEEEESEGEESENEEIDEEGSVITLEGSDIEEEAEEELKEITLKDIDDNIKRLRRNVDETLKEIQKLEISNPTLAKQKSEETEKVFKELEDYEELKKRLTESVNLLYKPVRRYEIDHLTEEEQQEYKELELDVEEYKKLKIKNAETIEDLNKYEEIVTPEDLTHNVPAYSETFMKETIFNKHGLKLDAGAVLEKNISGKENQKLAEAITGDTGSIISWTNEELIKPVVINGKAYKISEGQASKFCYDNYDNEKYNLIECKKYDGSENFEKLVKEYTEQYNNFFTIYKKEIDDTKDEIEKIKLLIDSFEDLEDDDFDENTEKYKGMSLKELKKEKEKLKNELSEEIGYSTTNGKFDEDKFKLLFYKRSRYTGITMKITKFPDAGVEYIDFNKKTDIKKINSSPNSESYYKKLADRGRRLFSVEASKNDIGKVSNITSGSKSTGQDINKVLDTKFKFKEKGKQKNNYDIVFTVATDDALLKFNYTDFIKKRIGSNQFVANFFRGTYSFYNKEPLLDSVLIPLDCFVPIKLSEVYNIQAKPKQTRKKKIGK